jgi:FAD/FMN-containing dehydrogenase
VLLWNGAISRQPALVVQSASSREVAAAVAFARDNDALLSVKGGGHSVGADSGRRSARSPQ